MEQKQNKPIATKWQQSEGPWYLKAAPLLQCFIAGTTGFLLLGIFVLIVFNADVLGLFWFPLALAYLCALAAAGYWARSRIERNNIHALIGDELYYKHYPAARHFHERKLKRQAKKAEKSALRKE